MYTRQQYLNGECTHQQYYAQFVTERVKEAVLKRFGKDVLIQAYAKDHWFNNVANLGAWDRLTMFAPINAQKFREVGDYSTLAGLVCVLKEAARQIVEDSTNETTI